MRHKLGSRPGLRQHAPRRVVDRIGPSITVFPDKVPSGPPTSVNAFSNPLRWIATTTTSAKSGRSRGSTGVAPAPICCAAESACSGLRPVTTIE
jgi:hypothetical protein